ncbi:MAG: YbaB/EbfC family nucleoid-associated protein [Coriobacteriales bacterium]|nr:YbaB/EbfC family nucleoid-associated protein [Coriobacteriales bacterium]
MAFDMQQMMQQARKVQEQLVAAQDDLKDRTYSASAGGGMVKVTMSGDMKLTDVTIDPAALDPNDVDLLQDMIVAAVNECLGSVNDAANQSMSQITGGLNIPGLF